MGPGVLSFLLCLSMSLVGVASSGGTAGCPLQCVCETRPWFSSQSVYHQARTVDCNELHSHTVPANISTDTQVSSSQSNNISSITTESQNMSNSTESDSSQNRFTQVSSMGSSSSVHSVTLYVEENQSEESEDFGSRNSSSSEELYINHNHISSIGPRAFSGLTNSLRLHSNSNRSVAIDSRWFESSPSSEISMIGENPISGLEEKNFSPSSRLHSSVSARIGSVSVPSAAFVGSDYSESSSFFDNKSRSVPRDASSALPNSKFSDSNRNPISRIQRGDFQNLSHSEELSSNNMEDLSSVERGAFQNLPAITKSELCNNPQSSYIDPRAFRDLPSLRTLLLLNNQSHLLSGDVSSSSPSLQESSLHSNPSRCDCLTSWGSHSGNQSHLKSSESSMTICSSPQHSIGRELREVVAAGWGGGGANSCLPHISPHAFPPVSNVSAGQPITLECWADADPAPQFYWVTPTGDKVSSEAVAAPIVSEEGRGSTRKKKRKHHMSEPGASVIERAEPSDAGVYTCVAWNMEGADTRSVSVSVDPMGSPRSWTGNSSSSAASSSVSAKVVHAHSVVSEWKSDPSRGTSVVQNQYDSGLPVPRWTSAVIHINNPQISYTAQVPADVQEYNSTHSVPATRYHVCLTVSRPPPPSSPPAAAAYTSCSNVTTKEAGFQVEPVASRRGGVASAAVSGSVFAVSVVMSSVAYMGRRVTQHKSCGQSSTSYMKHAASIPLSESYPPLITSWDGEADKDKDEDKEDDGERQIDTNKTYMW